MSAGDNINCFYRISLICNVCIVLVKTLNAIWIRMLYHMNYAYNSQAYDLHTVSSLDRWCLCYFQLVSSVWSFPWSYIMIVFIQITINWMSQLPLILQFVPMAISLKRCQFWEKFKCWKSSCSRLFPKLGELIWHWFGHYRSVWDHT